MTEQFNTQQQEAYNNYLNTARNIACIGRRGTGKTTIANRIINHTVNSTSAQSVNLISIEVGRTYRIWRDKYNKIILSIVGKYFTDEEGIEVWRSQGNNILSIFIIRNTELLSPEIFQSLNSAIEMGYKRRFSNSTFKLIVFGAPEQLEDEYPIYHSKTWNAVNPLVTRLTLKY